MGNIELKIGSTGKSSRVLINGQDIPCRKVVITTEIGHATMIELECVKIGGEPYTIKGRFVEEEEDDG